MLTASPHSHYVTDTAFVMHSKSEVLSADIFDLERNRFVNLQGQKLNWLGVKKKPDHFFFLLLSSFEKTLSVNLLPPLSPSVC